MVFCMYMRDVYSVVHWRLSFMYASALFIALLTPFALSLVFPLAFNFPRSRSHHTIERLCLSLCAQASSTEGISMKPTHTHTHGEWRLLSEARPLHKSEPISQFHRSRFMFIFGICACRQSVNSVKLGKYNENIRREWDDADDGKIPNDFPSAKFSPLTTGRKAHSFNCKQNRKLYLSKFILHPLFSIFAAFGGCLPNITISKWLPAYGNYEVSDKTEVVEWKRWTKYTATTNPIKCSTVNQHNSSCAYTHKVSVPKILKINRGIK